MPDVCTLGVNIDHVATLRQARGTTYPDPVTAALMAENAGADGITLHLREDRRHIQDNDVYELAERLTTHMNLEMAVTDDMLQVAERVRPADCCLVPERREELTTEGGLDIAGQIDRVAEACSRLASHGTRASLFIDPETEQLDAACEAGATVIELHTGAYADAPNSRLQAAELERLRKAVQHGITLGLKIHAGHGLHYDNVQPVAGIRDITELNIGHAIIARSIFDGLAVAVAEMKRLMLEARSE